MALEGLDLNSPSGYGGQTRPEDPSGQEPLDMWDRFTWSVASPADLIDHGGGGHQRHPSERPHRGLQRRLISSVTGSIPHVVVKPAERAPLSTGKETRYTGQVVKLEQQKRKIEDWRVWLERYNPNILAVSPVVEGQGILARGTKRKAITAAGMVPEQHNRVVELQSKLGSGKIFRL